tara:strand:- start:546 stop:992 length:447 start_codon:yes stop_codon:yes gene_type:complete
MKVIKKLSPILLVLLLISSCANKDDNKILGQALGAAAGGIIGAQFGAGTGKLLLTALGAGVGSYLGGEIAEYLTEDEKVSLHNSIYSSAKNGELKKTYLWKNDSQDVSALISPVAEYESENGKCRKMKIKIISGSDSELSDTDICHKV